MQEKWQKHLGDFGIALITAFFITLVIRVFFQGSLQAFLQSVFGGTPENAQDLATVLFGVLLTVLLFIAAHFEENTLPQHDSSRVRVRYGKGELYLDAASVCDQVFIATSKVMHVKCSEVEVFGINGDAYIILYAQIDTSAMLNEKHAELRAAIQEMADRLHIRLSGEPIIHAKLPQLRGARTVKDMPTRLPTPSSNGGIFGRLRSEPPRSSSIFGRSGGSIFGTSSKPPKPPERPSPFANSPLDGEAPSRPSGSLFGGRFRDVPPEPPDSDDQDDDK
ncbi:MAG: hypothetical protein DYG88_02475 [Chloroflexi bacterium CFX4]|nr:hypothetical protein [Chloroflexi bacterium CFX4]MDL1922519.1 hypothetical protein [Chloroflexi bacterium CFX3]